MTFAERWRASEALRGVVGWLPADESVPAAAEAGLDFIAVDLERGPTDELALRRLAGGAKAARLGLVVIAEAPLERLVALGADIVIPPGDGSMRVTDDVDDLARLGQPVGLDVTAAMTKLVGDFARASDARSAPLVLLPGMLGSAGLFADVVVDLPATINCRPLRIDLDESVADAAESVLAAAPPRFALAGHSLGGVVALEVWRRAPNRVTRLALLNASARAPSDLQLATWSELRERTDSGRFTEVVAEQATLNVGGAGVGRPDLVTRWIELAGEVGPEGLLRQLSMQASRSDLGSCLGEIDVPTMVLSGTVDAVCPPAIQAELAAAIPGAVHVTIDGAGHMSPLDHPAEVSAALGRWLER